MQIHNSMGSRDLWSPILAVMRTCGALFAVSVLALLPTASAFAADTMEVGYTKTNLVSDTPGLAQTTDPNLVNPWGLSHTAFGPWWISDNNAGMASIYNGDGTSAAPSIVIPAPSGGSGGTPTGNVVNKLADFAPQSFAVKEGMNVGPSAFMFATEDGTILGWNKAVDSSKAIIAVDRSKTTDHRGDIGAVYKGLAFGFSNFQPYIYATNFRFGTVEMFDSNFQLVRSFTDPQLSTTCVVVGQCYAPFGIQNIDGKLYVTFALQDMAKHDDQAGAGRGFVDVFNTDGTLEKRLIAHGNLNSPWGLTQAAFDFGQFSRDLLVGNFGDGTINAYNPTTGTFEGTLKDQKGNIIQTDGLWGLAFGNGFQAGKINDLFFTAGIGGESHGVFGKIAENE